MKPTVAGVPRHRDGGKPAARSTTAILLRLSVVILLLLLCLNFPTEVRLPRSIHQHFATSAGEEAELRLLVGIMTLGYKYELRHLQRLVNSMRPPPANVKVDVRFVVCRLTHEEDQQLVALEVLRFNDLLFLDCRENGNGGKTHAFFSAVAREYGGGGGRRRTYDYVMKTDDDTYIRYPELVESLLPLPREDLYYGHMVPAGEHHKGSPLFMKGMGYVLSWDLVEWVESSDFAKNNSLGPEDSLVGLWLRHGGRGKNIYDTKPSPEQVREWRSGGDRLIDDRKATQYDLPWPPRRFMPRTISVHRLKDRAKWAQVLRYFNVTAGVGFPCFGSSSSC